MKRLTAFSTAIALMAMLIGVGSVGATEHPAPPLVQPTDEPSPPMEPPRGDEDKLQLKEEQPQPPEQPQQEEPAPETPAAPAEPQ